MKYLLALLLSLSMTAQAGIIPDLGIYSDSGAQAIKFNDYSSGTDNSFFEMKLEAGSYAPNNQMGLYLYNTVTHKRIGGNDGYFEIFSGVQAVGDYTNLAFDFTSHSITRTRGNNSGVFPTTDIIETFGGLGSGLDFEANLFRELSTLDLGFYEIGVYLNNEPGDYFYSHDDLNDDDIRHVAIYEVQGPTNGLIFAWEDQYGGGDWDYDDMIVSATDVSIDVPEPGTIALFGLALMSFAIRKRIKL